MDAVPALKRGIRFRDLVLFYVVSGLSVRWTAMAAAAGPSILIVWVAALVCFFPTLVNGVRGLEAVNPQALELMRVLSASRSEVFFKLRVYAALPYLFSALRIAASMSVIGAVVGEWIGATQGIGAMIIQATYNFDSALLYAAITMSACLSGCFFMVIVALERMVIRWQPDHV